MTGECVAIDDAGGRDFEFASRKLDIRIGGLHDATILARRSLRIDRGPTESTTARRKR